MIKGIFWFAALFCILFFTNQQTDANLQPPTNALKIKMFKEFQELKEQSKNKECYKEVYAGEFDTLTLEEHPLLKTLANMREYFCKQFKTKHKPKLKICFKESGASIWLPLKNITGTTELAIGSDYLIWLMFDTSVSEEKNRELFNTFLFVWAHEYGHLTDPELGFIFNMLFASYATYVLVGIKNAVGGKSKNSIEKIALLSTQASIGAIFFFRHRNEYTADMRALLYMPGLTWNDAQRVLYLDEITEKRWLLAEENDNYSRFYKIFTFERVVGQKIAPIIAKTGMPKCMAFITTYLFSVYDNTHPLDAKRIEALKKLVRPAAQ